MFAFVQKFINAKMKKVQKVEADSPEPEPEPEVITSQSQPTLVKINPHRIGWTDNAKKHCKCR